MSAEKILGQGILRTLMIILKLAFYTDKYY